MGKGGEVRGERVIKMFGRRERECAEESEKWCCWQHTWSVDWCENSRSGKPYENISRYSIGRELLLAHDRRLASPPSTPEAFESLLLLAAYSLGQPPLSRCLQPWGASPCLASPSALRSLLFLAAYSLEVGDSSLSMHEALGASRSLAACSLEERLSLSIAACILERGASSLSPPAALGSLPFYRLSFYRPCPKHITRNLKQRHWTKYIPLFWETCVPVNFSKLQG